MRLVLIHPNYHSGGAEIAGNWPPAWVAYLTGPLFFASTGNFAEALAQRDEMHVVILSMRAVPLIDLSGIEALATLNEELRHAGKRFGIFVANFATDRLVDPQSVSRLKGKNIGYLEVTGASHNAGFSPDQAQRLAEASQRYFEAPGF